MANSFEIKSAQLPLVSLFLKTTDLQQVTLDFIQQYGQDGENSGFFDNDALVIDFSKTSGSVNPEDLGRLLAALPSCRLKPIAFRNGNPDVVAASLALGLIEVPADLPRATTSSRAAIQAPVEVIKEVVTEVVREIPGPPTMVLDKPLRSGQKIYARGSDLVVLAMVNQGAEVVADGNIHVYAPLRGKAMAGASGNTQARIFSLCLEPELISIAGVYRTSENPLAADVQGKPAQVRLSNDGQEKLLFEALNP